MTDLHFFSIIHPNNFKIMSQLLKMLKLPLASNISIMRREKGDFSVEILSWIALYLRSYLNHTRHHRSQDVMNSHICVILRRHVIQLNIHPKHSQFDNHFSANHERRNL